MTDHDVEISAYAGESRWEVKCATTGQVLRQGALPMDWDDVLAVLGLFGKATLAEERRRIAGLLGLS